MSLRNFFRLLIIASPLFSGLGLGSHWITAPHVSADWRTILEWSGDGGWPDNLVAEDPTDWMETGWAFAGIVALFALMTMSLVVQVGLFYFYEWARAPYLYLVIISLLMTPLQGLHISLPLEECCDQLSILADGAILALAYFSPIRREFKKVPDDVRG